MNEWITKTKSREEAAENNEREQQEPETSHGFYLNNKFNS